MTVKICIKFIFKYVTNFFVNCFQTRYYMIYIAWQLYINILCWYGCGSKQVFGVGHGLTLNKSS